MRQENEGPHQYRYKNVGILVLEGEKKQKKICSTFHTISRFILYLLLLRFFLSFRLYAADGSDSHSVWGIPCLTHTLIIPQMLQHKQNKKSPFVCSLAFSYSFVLAFMMAVFFFFHV